MKIKVAWGTGAGKTKIAAFDNALWDAGIANYNPIRLSSVIPENSDVVMEKIDMNKIEHGHKLYVVIAEGYETEPGKKVVAGLPAAIGSILGLIFLASYSEITKRF